MISPDIENINVTSFAPMPSPEALHGKLPLTDLASETVMKGREAPVSYTHLTLPTIYSV